MPTIQINVFQSEKEKCCADSWRTLNLLPASFRLTSVSFILRYCKHNCYVKHRGQSVRACMWEWMLMQAFVFSLCSRRGVRLLVFVWMNGNAVERSPIWLNSHNHPEAHGKSVGGQVWIGDRRRRAGWIRFTQLTAFFKALGLCIYDSFSSFPQNTWTWSVWVTSHVHVCLIFVCAWMENCFRFNSFSYKENAEVWKEL